MKMLASVLRGMLLWSLLVAEPGATQAGQQGPPRPAVPVEPITAIIDAFRMHDVVALGEGAHNNEQSHAFRLKLLRDPRFAATVNDIVVESGNARYQDVMDRFVRGDDVPSDVLRQAWRNTTQAHAIWDVPIYEEFFRSVRAVNASLPRERQLRVLLGDPPIDWDTIHSREDLDKWMASRDINDRDRYPAEIIRREVLAKHRRALVIYGDMHLQRRDLLANFQPFPGRELLLPILEREANARVFSVWTNTSVDLNAAFQDAAAWPAPALIVLRDSVLGKKDFTFYFPGQAPRFKLKDGISRWTSPGDSTVVPPGEERSLNMEDQFDALLYLGPPSSITMARLDPALCSDKSYLDMRLWRMSLVPFLGVGRGNLVDQLKQYCAAVAPK